MGNFPELSELYFPDLGGEDRRRIEEMLARVKRESYEKGVKAGLSKLAWDGRPTENENVEGYHWLIQPDGKEVIWKWFPNFPVHASVNGAWAGILNGDLKSPSMMIEKNFVYNGYVKDRSDNADTTRSEIVARVIEAWKDYGYGEQRELAQKAVDVVIDATK